MDGAIEYDPCRLYGVTRWIVRNDRAASDFPGHQFESFSAKRFNLFTLAAYGVFAGYGGIGNDSWPHGGHVWSCAYL